MSLHDWAVAAAGSAAFLLLPFVPRFEDSFVYFWPAALALPLLLIGVSVWIGTDLVPAFAAEKFLSADRDTRLAAAFWMPGMVLAEEPLSAATREAGEAMVKVLLDDDEEIRKTASRGLLVIREKLGPESRARVVARVNAAIDADTRTAGADPSGPRLVENPEFVRPAMAVLAAYSA